MARDYGDCKFGSVTQIIGDVLRKPGLEWWFKHNSAEFCDETSAKGKMIGTVVHSLIQAHIEEMAFEIETDYQAEVQYAVKSFFKFRRENPNIKLMRAEMKVTSNKYKYIGTLDCKAKAEVLMILDWKSGECKVGTPKETEKPPIYPEMEYQVTAYVKAHNEQEKEQITKAGIMVLAKDKVAYNYMTLSEQKMDEIFERVFIPCISIYYYQKENDSYGKPKARQGSDNFTKGSRGFTKPGAKLPCSF